jgi:benzylsuccinate CoA-transferase BbsE subunit
MLSCYRILDLTNERGFCCGKILGDMGADVIKIEKPGGDPARRIGPFYHDEVHPEKSLYWFAFNGNKRGITLDIETSDGKELFKKLVRKADVVLESFGPGYMESIGLGLKDLSEINPGIVFTRISGFGQEGPYRDYRDPDIVVRAMGGLMYMVGEPERPPLTTTYHHVHLLGAIHGAIGTVVALNQRALTGKGQQVDAPAHLACGFVGGPEVQVPWMAGGIVVRRDGKNRFPMVLKDGSLFNQPMLWQCKDGWVAFTLQMGPKMREAYLELINIIKHNGMDTLAMEKWDWASVNSTDWGPEDLMAISDTIRKYFLTHTKAELLEMALKLGIHLGPCMVSEELVASPQLKARDFWREIIHPELNTKITYPGGFVKFTDNDCGIRFRAPLIGEHNEEIYIKELGISKEELISLKHCGVL